MNLQHTTFPTQPRAPTQTWARARTRAAIRSQPAVIVMAAAALAVTLVSQPGTARAEGGGPEPVPPFGVCPHAEVRAFFSGPGDPLSDQPIADRLAIEEQVLTLCLERQTLIRQVYEQDRAIAELRQPEVDANTRDLPPAIPEAAQTRNIGLDNTPSTGLLAPAPTNQPPEQTGAPVAQAPQTDSTAQTTADRRPAPVPSGPSLTWFTITGTGEALVAGISDGHNRWFAAPGMELPGGVTVLSIAVRPPGVRVRASGQTYLLAYQNAQATRTAGTNRETYP